eukprot:1104012-Ditylum_brightwellii.AAC.1
MPAMLQYAFQNGRGMHERVKINRRVGAQGVCIPQAQASENECNESPTHKRKRMKTSVSSPLSTS